MQASSHLARWQTLGFIALFVTVGTLWRAKADDAVAPPPYKVLVCEEKCGKNYVPAVAIDKTPPEFPLSDTGLFGSAYTVYSEGIVIVRFVIGTDGHTKDVAIDKLIGPNDMAERARKAVSAWTYKPAIQDGVPVEEPSSVEFIYTVEDGQEVAREFVAHAYRKAESLAGDGKIDDAIAAFQDILKYPKLNFYERSTISYALSLLYMNKSDYAHARQSVRDATMQGSKYLDKKTRVSALRLRIQLEAVTGEFAESMSAFEQLKKIADLKPDDHEQQIIDKVHAALDGTAPLAVDAVVPTTDVADSWHHTLLRRRFDFQNISGKLDHFKLRCGPNGIESPINDQAQWTVPKSWGGCQLYVFGNPDTKFQLVESRT